MSIDFVILVLHLSGGLRMEIPVKLTAVFEKVPKGYIAYVEELPGANSQGTTLEDARENLKEAVELVLEANRKLTEERLKSRTVVKEAFQVP
jgi:predicted RNase H-like HicB family nuclease